MVVSIFLLNEILLSMRLNPTKRFRVLFINRSTEKVAESNFAREYPCFNFNLLTIQVNRQHITMLSYFSQQIKFGVLLSECIDRCNSLSRPPHNGQLAPQGARYPQGLLPPPTPYPGQLAPHLRNMANSVLNDIYSFFMTNLYSQLFEQK